MLAAATYSGSFTLSGKNGTASAGITIEAATPGTAIFAAGSTLVVNSCAYVTVKGLTFGYELGAGNVLAFRGTANRCRVTRCTFGPTSIGSPGTTKATFIYGGDSAEHIRVDHNEFRNKANPGNAILFDGNFTTSQACRHIRIDHNIIRSIKPEVDNEKEPIRLGVSSMSKSMSYSVVERNVFTDCICEPEVVSVKAGGVRVSGNTVLRCIGGLVYRHGTNGLLADNYIVDRVATFGATIGSGGLRFYDASHEVSYNYVDAVYGGNFQNALMLDTGDAEGASTNLSGHWRVVNALVERNVLVGNPTGIVIGDNYDSAPTGCTIRDNIVAQATSGTAITQKIAPVSSTLTNNAYYPTPAGGGMVQGADTIWRKAGFGPRLTYLQQADVGPNGDTGDTDGTGVLVGGSSPTPPVDPGTATTAAEKFGWGAPLPSSDEFEYTGAPAGAKWNVYNSVGHDGNGVRSPARVTVANGTMTLTGLAGSANTAGLEHTLDQTYGRWEVRARSFYTASPTTPGTLSGGYHPVLIVWPDDDPTGATGGTTTVGAPVGQTTKMTEGFAGTLSDTLWSAVQTHSYEGAPSGYGTGSDYRLRVNHNAGADHPSVLRTEVRDGDTAVGSHERSEISSFGKAWNDRNGDETWYEFDVRFGDPDWSPGWSSTNDWLIFFQNHQVNDDGSPPIALSVHNDNKIYVEREPDGEVEFLGPLWTVRPGVWEHVVVHVKWSPNSSIGFVQIHVNGTEVLPKTFRKTMYTTDNVDPYYAKLGQYRRSSISGTTVVMHDNLRVSNGPATSGTTTAPARVDWPYGGEYDLLENGEPGQQAAGAFLHYPSLDGVDHQIDVADFPVDLREFHNFAFEWSPDGLKGWVDGTPWFSHAGGAAADRKDLQAMHRGHLTVQLDAFQATGLLASTMELEWVRVYSLTPTGPVAGPQTITAIGFDDPEAFGVPTITGANPAPPSGSVLTQLGVNTVLGASTLGYTPGGAPTPPGVQVVSRVGGIGALRLFGVPVLAVADGPQTVSPVGIRSAADFGRPRVGIGPPASPPAPGGVLVPTLFAVADDGVTLSPLPAWESMTLSPVRNSAGAVEIVYPAGAPGFGLLHDSVSASPLRACEIRVWLGGNATGALGGWLVSKSGDDLTPGSPWRFSGHFHEWLLSKAIIAPQAIDEANKNGELRFAGATAGLILATIMDQAQARGALPLVSRDFTTTHDSNGNPWSNAISSLKLAPKTTCAQVADKLVELGMCEYEFTAGRVWRAFNPGGQGGDRTTGPTPLTFAAGVDLSEAARRESMRDSGTAVLVAGSEGFYEWASSPTAQAQLGWRAEVGADAGQLNSRAAVQAVAPRYLETASAGVAEHNAAVEFGLGAPIPLIDYAVGDWAYLRTGVNRDRMRIAQVELEFGRDAPARGKVVFNDLITDRITALYRRLNAISTGDAVVGTSESTPGGAGEDTIPPAAPTGVTVASTEAYQQPGESETYALVIVGWAPVTTNAYADAETADKARAAGLIADRMYAGQTIAEDWTWSGAPAVVGAYNDVLLDEWRSAPTNPGGNDSVFSVEAAAWLDGYAVTHAGGGAVTDDVANYRVQWRFTGSQVVPSRQDPGNGVPGEPTPPRDPGAFPADAAWFEPGESPTTTNRIEFGGVLAGRAIQVRVQAVDRAGNRGPWSAIVGVVTAIDNQPPPTPSKPIVAAWFRTMDITWDGKGSSGEDMFAAAPDVSRGGGIEVHVDTGIDFTPHRPIGAGGTVDLASSRTYKATLYSAGTWNVVDLEIGVTYYARFVAVDRSGNASDPSETSDGVLPERLVNIDIGPDAIGRAQIIDGEIVRAKIADLAVNDAKIESLDVGKIRTGTLTATVTVSGRIETPLTNGNQIQIDNGGIRMYRGGTVVGRWEVFDGSILITGQYNSAVTGQRVVINPGGGNPDTIRFYPTFSDVYSSIDSVDFQGGTVAGIRIVGSGTSSVANKGMVIVRDQYASLVHGRTDLSYWGSEIWVEQNFTRNKSATVDLIVDERLSPLSGPRRVAMIHYNTAGQPINATGLYYGKTEFEGGEPFLYGNARDVGIVFAPGVLRIRNNPNGDWRGIEAASFTTMSGRDFKRNVRAVEADPMEVVRGAKPRQYQWHTDPDDAPDKIGLIAEELPYPIRKTVVSTPTDPHDEPIVSESYDLAGAVALLWGAVRSLDKRLAELADQPAPKKPPTTPPRRKINEEPDA